MENQKLRETLEGINPSGGNNDLDNIINNTSKELE